MKEFPSNLNVKNKDNFPVILYNRVSFYLRKEVYEHLIKIKCPENENSYFDIEKFNKKFLNDMDITQKIVSTITSELINLGWKCKLSFGGTALFIFSTEKPPPSCWDDGL